MWTRADLKQQAKAGLKQYYWYGVLVILINVAISVGTSLLTQFLPFINLILSPLISILLLNVIAAGQVRFFTISTLTGHNAGVGELFGCFKDGRYGNTVKVMFLKWLFQLLWTLLLVVPGIIKHYEYYMVPYLVAEYPEKDSKEIFSLSKQMMNGNKFYTFVLELSFIGWWILAAICCGIGLLFLAPYMNATFAELYLQLKEDRLGIPRGGARPSSQNGNFQNNNQGTISMNSFNGGAAGGQATQYIGTSDDGQTRQLTMSGNVKSGYVVGIQGAFSGANVPVMPGDVLVIGSDAKQCNLVIQGAEVSPVHIKITFDGVNFQANDCSAAGTYDMQKGRLPKGQTVTLSAGTYLQMGTRGDIFSLECR